VLIVSNEEQRHRSEDRQGDEGGEDRKVCHELITTEDTEDTEDQPGSEQNRSSVSSVVESLLYRHK
jgi:hypothetical protein